MPTAVLFYDVVVFIHVAAIVIAFGITFTYPLIAPHFVEMRRKAAPAWFELDAKIGSRIIMPAATVALLAGSYLASDRDYWDQTWVTVPATILVVLLGLGGAFFIPTERRLAAVAERDVAAAGEGEVVWSEEFTGLNRRLAIVGGLANLLILIALFFMVVKP